MASFRNFAVQGVRPIALPEGVGLETVSVDINWADAGAGVLVSDVIQLADIPAGFEVVDWKFITDDIDSNGTPTVAFTLGYLNAAKTAMGAGTFDTFTSVGGITAAQTAGAAVPTGVTAGNAYLAGRTAAVRTIGLLATAATATAALAGKRATLLLFMRAGMY